MNMDESSINLLISHQDYRRLSQLLRLQGLQATALLARKLSEAEIVSQVDIPPDLVTMNSVVELTDDLSGLKTLVTLVYPLTANPNGQVSILSPLGVRILGLRIGHVVDWPGSTTPARRLWLSNILFQPEAAGIWNL
jgi:regulator of nucleoside diphosphate kinase